MMPVILQEGFSVHFCIVKFFTMNTLFQTNQSRLVLYINENEHWLKTIITQESEIPVFEKMLVNNEAVITDDESIGIKVHFSKELELHHEQMKQLNTELGIQQQRLEKDAAQKSLYDINALCSQDILRDRIKDVEKKYIELKCNFMKFLSGVI